MSLRPDRRDLVWLRRPPDVPAKRNPPARSHDKGRGQAVGFDRSAMIEVVSVD